MANPKFSPPLPTLSKAIVLSAALLCATASSAADAPVVVQPVPLVQEGRFFPGLGNEGFIITRFTVKADGTTSDIEIAGGFGADSPFLERPITDAVSKWTFTPGTVNGQPADFLNQEYVFRPKLSETLASSSDFQEAYAELDELVRAQDFDGAVRMINGSFRDHVHTVLDYGVTQYALSRIYVAQNDVFAALDAIKKATMYSLDMAGEREYMLTPELLEAALRQHLVLAASLRQQGEVLRSWESLDLLYDIPADDRVHELVSQARAATESTDPLVALGKIIEDEWTYQPVHRIFTVADVMGELESITARCEHRNLELEYQAGVDWTLPPSLGKCALDFAGDDDTTFTLYEFKE